MENYQTLQPVYDDSVVTLWLSRLEVHNALNYNMIHEIISFFTHVEERNEIRVVIIRGRGKSFCSGADLQWMKNAFALSEGENLQECEALTMMFGVVFNSSKIVVAAVHGNVFGGGNGLVAVCDLAYGLTSSAFSLSETRIGMAAVSITPYLLQKIKATDLKELIFSAKIFNGAEAVQYGLLNQTFQSQEELDLFLNKTISLILENGSQALITSKHLINRITLQSMSEEMGKIPALLARIRVSAEAQEGFTAFLEKRKPNW